MSALVVWRKGELLKKQTSISSVKNLQWRDFESVVGDLQGKIGNDRFWRAPSSPLAGLINNL
jgi:hypothetical protein